MKGAFEAVENTMTKDIHFWCDNLLFRLFTVHYWAFYLNRHKNRTIFSSNSTFFYDLLPWLGAQNRRIELLHNFTYGKKGMEFFGFANYQYLDLRITVDAFTAQNIRDQYQQAGISDIYVERIKTIEPGVAIPATQIEKDASPLRILYAGRGGPQKRVWLIDKIAAHCYERKWDVEFHFAGDMADELSEGVKGKSIMHGLISDPLEMKQLYALVHVIILTSAYEGFPMVIKEGMANGCIPLVTALPGNLTHLKHLENALLIYELEIEPEIIAEGLSNIKTLIENKELGEKLCTNCRNYAQAHFNQSQFLNAYKIVLENPLKS